MNRRKLLISICALSAMTVGAQVRLSVDAAQRGVEVSPMLYGIFFEDINHAADGGLYAELISNRSFEDSKDATPTWSTSVAEGAKLDTKLVDKGLLNDAQGRALELNVQASPASPVRLVNEGFWGINAVQGRSYKLTFWAKGKYKGHLTARLTSADGSKIYAETLVEKQIAKTWTKYEATLLSNGNDERARFELVADGKGTITLDVVSLFPPTFRNRPNGCRPDLAELLLELKPKFMRFPGGCYVEGQESPDNAFHWERTIGPIEERPGHLNRNWNYRTSDGLGFHEFLQLSEDLGAKPLYVVNVGLWHGGLTPVEELQPWIDECMNALEYANGDVTTKYGAMRAKNGHPAPFNIEYLEIGNENNQPVPEQQSDRYYERYKLFKDAVLAKYPQMHLIGNVVAWGDDNPTWDSPEQVELLDEHYYRNPAWFADNFHKYDSYRRGGSKIYCGEYAVTQGFGRVGNLNAALGEAVFMMGMENNSDVVDMASYAPIFVNENNVAWQPDMIRFNSARVMCTPSYYVQKLLAQHVGTRMLKVEQENPYKMQSEASQKAGPVRVGVGSWATDVSFSHIKVTTPVATIEDDCKNIASFENLKGAWIAQNGAIHQKSKAEACLLINKVPVTSEKYSYTCKARKNDGAEGFLIVFNYVDANNYSWFNLGGWGNGQHGLERVADGGKGQAATTPGKIESGKWYDVRVDVDGDSVTCYLDNAQVFATRLKENVSAGLFSNASLDETTGELIVKVVNTAANGTTACLDLKNFKASSARLIRMGSANGNAENTIEVPTNVYPMESMLCVEGNSLTIDVPAYSLNILRLKP
ncbi:MAG: carbohydrate binding domain-containing protein [Prevotella sp.]|nr:carbohydrate binding domain-containing protein [Prevotella sp.]